MFVNTVEEGGDKEVSFVGSYPRVMGNGKHTAFCPSRGGVIALTEDP